MACKPTERGLKGAIRPTDWSLCRTYAVGRRAAGGLLGTRTRIAAKQTLLNETRTANGSTTADHRQAETGQGTKPLAR